MRRFWRFYFLRVILILVGLELIYFAWLQYHNRRPEVIEDNASVYERHSIKVDILRNDTDQDEDDTIHIANIDQPSHGTYIKVGDRSIEYTPDKGFIGIDSFQYTVNDGKSNSKPGYIKIRVDENKAPSTNTDQFNIFPWSMASLPVMNNDREVEGDTMYIKSFEQALFGEVRQEGNNLVYIPSGKSTGIDSFTYILSDGFKDSKKTSVIIHIKDVKSSIFCSSSYYGDLKNYEANDPSKWDIINETGNIAVCINTSSYDGLSGNRAGCYNIVKDRWFNGNFELSARIKCTDNLAQNNASDYAIYFAYIDINNYCYASFSSHEEGEGFTGLFKIENGQRQQVLCKGQAFTDNNYHQIRVVRKGKEVATYVDGKEMCKASDDVFALKGKIGIGSYNDMACFDDINVIGNF